LSHIFLIFYSAHRLFAGKHHYDSAPLYCSNATDAAHEVNQQMLVSVTPTILWQNKSISVTIENNKYKMHIKQSTNTQKFFHWQIPTKLSNVLQLRPP